MIMQGDRVARWMKIEITLQDRDSSPYSSSLLSETISSFPT